MSSKWIVAMLAALVVLLCPVVMQEADAGEAADADILDSVTYDGGVLSVSGTSHHADGTPVHIELTDSKGSPVSVALTDVQSGKYSVRIDVGSISIDSYKLKCTFTPLGSVPSVMVTDVELGGSMLKYTFSASVLTVNGTSSVKDGTPVHIELLDSNGKALAVGLARVASGAYSASLDVGYIPIGEYMLNCMFTPLGEPSYTVSSVAAIGGYTVVYDTNGGSEANTVVYLDSGSVVDLSVDAGVRDGYEFRGWAMERGATVPLTGLSVSADTVLYAVWYQESVAPQPPSVVKVTGVSVSPDKVAMTVGDKSGLAVTVSPADADNKAVTWSSSDPSVVTVGTGGELTAVGPGSAVITVKTVDGSFTATSSVTVKEAEAPVVKPEVEVSGNDVNALVSESDIEAALGALESKDSPLEIVVEPNVTVKDPKVTVTLPASGMEAVKEAGVDIKVITPVADFVIPFEAVTSLADGKGNLSLCVSEAASDDLTDNQKKATEGASVFSISLKVGDSTVTGDMGGKIEVSIPYKLKGGNTDHLAVYCVSDNGELEKFDCTYDGRSVNFATPHLSIWSISEKAPETEPEDDGGDDETPETEPEDDGGEDGSVSMAVYAAVAAIIILAAVMLFVFLRRKA